jgi:hypothetical protein
MAADPKHLLAVTGRRIAAVQSGDIDAVMAALVDEPVFDLWPIGLRLSGQQDVRRYYGHFLGEVMPRATGGELVGTYVGQDEVAFEFVTTYRSEGGEVETFHILAIQPVIGDRVAGERLYGSDRYMHLIVGDELWHLLEPITPT